MRPEAPGDAAAIHDVNTLAFQSQEADLVDALRRYGGVTTSLVPVQDDHRVGHSACSPVTITADTVTIAALGLAPLAVLPEDHKTGMGSKLVEAGLHACHHTPYGVVVVLGHPHVHPRFGFTPAKPHGIVWEHEVPDAVVMVQESKAGALARTRGVGKYRPECEAVSAPDSLLLASPASIP